MSKRALSHTDEEILALRRLIAKKAIESWYKLPEKTRAFVNVEDLIQDGLMFARKLMLKHDPKRAKFSTVLFHCLENRYRRQAEWLNAKKRFDGFALTLEDVERTAFDKNAELNVINVHVVRAFVSVYFDATWELRESLRRWFIQHDTTKIHTHGKRFNRDKKEFLSLAKKYQLDSNDCRILLSNSKCKSQVVEKLPDNILWNDNGQTSRMCRMQS
jgi:hypothetical protein